MVFDSENICFLISLPRSGSTLFQQLMSNHSQIATTAEPWLILPMVYAWKEHAANVSIYDTRVAQVALKELFTNEPLKQDDYYKVVADQVTEVYRRIAHEQGKRFFLDKTTRNYLIIDELASMFPKCKFLFLVRNPVTVFLSYLDLMTARNYNRLSDVSLKSDLLSAYDLIAEAAEKYRERSTMVKYEDLVQSPSEVLMRSLNLLGLQLEDGQTQYKPSIKGTVKDPKTYEHHSRPVANFIENWEERISNPLDLYFAREYLLNLSESTLEGLGYSPKLLLEKLESHLENHQGFKPAFSLMDFFQSNEQDKVLNFMKRTAIAMGVYDQNSLRRHIWRNPGKLFYFALLKSINFANVVRHKNRK